MNAVLDANRKLDDQSRMLAGLLNASLRTEAAGPGLIEGLFNTLREESEATRRAIREDRRLVWPNLQD